jgi:tetratricopeptide (TPR) repeat protein
MLARLQNRLKLLTGGDKDLPERQQTLRNTIGWSYDLLDEQEKLLFRRLAVFSGTGGLDAIEAVCGAAPDEGRRTKDGGAQGSDSTQHAILDRQASESSVVRRPSSVEDVLDSVASLVDKNLLRQVPEGGRDTRFAMFETIQEYAREKLEESGEAAAMLDRHAHHFLALVEEAEPHLRGPKQVEWLDRLETEHDNLRAALAWWMESGQSELALRLGAGLHQFWKMRSHMGEGRAWLGRVLLMSEGAATPMRAKALMAAGTLASDQWDFTQARALLEESLALFKELGDTKSAMNALRNLGNELRHQGDYQGASARLREGLGLAREAGARWDMAAILGDLGIVAQSSGREDEARKLYEESLALRRELKDKRGIAMMLVNLGEVARAQERYDEAHSLYAEALTLARELGDKWGTGMVLHNLGHVAFHRNEYEYAWELFTESLSLFA